MSTFASGPPELAGIDGEPVRALKEGDLGIWYSEIEAAPTPTLDRVREHHAVIETAMQAGTTPLPMRFGQWFATRERLRERLEEQGRGYAERLGVLDGALEFGVRIRDPAGEPEVEPEGKASSGREHLEGLARREAARREVEARGRELADELGTHTDGLVREVRIHSLKPGEGIVSVAHLVDREHAEAYQKEVVRFREERGDLVVHLSGPWPPYSFAD